MNNLNNPAVLAKLNKPVNDCKSEAMIRANQSQETSQTRKQQLQSKLKESDTSQKTDSVWNQKMLDSIFTEKPKYFKQSVALKNSLSQDSHSLKGSISANMSA